MNHLMDIVSDILFTDIRQLPHKLCKPKDIYSLNNHLKSSIVAVASHRGPRRINEDMVGSGSSQGLNYIILADGLGGYPHGRDAAQVAVKTFKREVEKIIARKKIIKYNDIKPMYRKTSVKVKKLARNSQGWKTTIICVIERPDDFLVSYLGDGQVYLVRGDTESAVPLMVGHRVKGLLGGVLGPEITAEPIIIQISKAFRSGEIIVAGTDGIFNQEIYTKKPNLLTDLISCLQNRFTMKEPNDILIRYLDQLHVHHLLDDNASLGVIMTRKAWEFGLRKNSYES